MNTMTTRWIAHLNRFTHTHAAYAAWDRNKSLRASDIIIGTLAVMLIVLGLAFVLTHLVSATANPAATDIELLESHK
jgi:hypothetical protein